VCACRMLGCKRRQEASGEEVSVWWIVVVGGMPSVFRLRYTLASHDVAGGSIGSIHTALHW
jgi:hypothetical protein